MDAASGRYPCDAQNCDQSSCAAIKNNYDASTRTFKTPPAIKRSDGSDALRQRDAKVYNGPFQVSPQDQEKLQQGASQQQPDGQQQQPVESATQAGQSKKSRRTRPRTSPTTPVSDVQQNVDEQNPWQKEQPSDPSQQQPEQPYESSQQQTNPPYHPGKTNEFNLFEETFPEFFKQFKESKNTVINDFYNGFRKSITMEFSIPQQCI